MIRFAVLFICAALLAAAEPIRLHRANSHYYEYAGKPTVLITSGEHYGALLNGAFQYVKYLDTLKADGLNLTRVFGGTYREVPGDFGITNNTLAPRHADFVSPWARVAGTKGNDGLGKFDLKKWNPAYWTRLHAILKAAAARGIVVELTPFCVFYQDRMWELSPFHAGNNVNGFTAVPRGEVLSLKHAALVAVQEEFLRKLSAELKDHDNLIYEIVNEPYVTGVPADWGRHMAKVLADAEAAHGRRHLIGWNVANFTAAVADPDPNLSFFNFHYARPPVAVAQNYKLDRVIGLDETGFDGTLDAIYRIQAWDFLIAGGAHYNNLDYSFTAGHEDGSFLVPGASPGGGSAALRRQLGILARFFAALDFANMRPAPDAIAGPLPAEFSARVIEQPGKVWALYVHTGRALPNTRPRYVYRTDRQRFSVPMNLPAGGIEITWWDTRSGKTESSVLDHAGGHAWVPTPEFTEDAAAVIRATERR